VQVCIEVKVPPSIATVSLNGLANAGEDAASTAATTKDFIMQVIELDSEKQQKAAK